MRTMILALGFLTTVLLAWGIYDLATASRRLILRRISRHILGVWAAVPAPSGGDPSPRGGGILPNLSRAVGRLQVLRPLISRVERELMRAHLALRPEEFLLIVGTSGAGGAFLLWLVARNVPALVVGAAGGLLVPILSLKRTQGRRLRKLEEQVPDLLAVLINALRAGHSLLQAINSVCDELPAPLSEEFAQALQELRMGAPLEDSLQRLSERLGSDDIDMVVTAVLIQRRVGGNLAEILERISHTCQGRTSLKLKLRSVTAQSRLSAAIISLLPVGFAAVLSVLSPDLFKLLLFDPLGRLLLILATFMEAVGIFLIRRVVRVRI